MVLRGLLELAVHTGITVACMFSVVLLAWLHDARAEQVHLTDKRGRLFLRRGELICVQCHLCGFTLLGT